MYTYIHSPRVRSAAPPHADPTLTPGGRPAHHAMSAVCNRCVGRMQPMCWPCATDVSAVCNRCVGRVQPPRYSVPARSVFCDQNTRTPEHVFCEHQKTSSATKTPGHQHPSFPQGNHSITLHALPGVPHISSNLPLCHAGRHPGAFPRSAATAPETSRPHRRHPCSTSSQRNTCTFLFDLHCIVDLYRLQHLQSPATTKDCW